MRALLRTFQPTSSLMIWCLLPRCDSVSGLKLNQIIFGVNLLPRPQDRMLHRCQLAGRGFHMQWCSRVAFPVRRCAQLTWRDWKPCRPQVVVHGVHGPTRQWRAQASVEQFFRELGLPMETHIKEKEGGAYLFQGISTAAHMWWNGIYLRTPPHILSGTLVVLASRQ